MMIIKYAFYTYIRCRTNVNDMYQAYMLPIVDIYHPDLYKYNWKCSHFYNKAFNNHSHHKFTKPKSKQFSISN